MGVISEFRSKGIGAQLIQHVLSWAKEKGFQKAYVNAYAANHQAIAFYRRHGFSEIDICLEREIN